MTTPASWRPATGANSVPFPVEAREDGPTGEAAYSRYLLDCQDAARRETAVEAATRCRAEADLLDDGGLRFDDVLDHLAQAFDSHLADTAGPEGELWKGMSLDECSYYGSGQLDQLRRAHVEMAAAFASLGRERFMKAAAEFATVVADWGITWVPRRAAAGTDGRGEPGVTTPAVS